MALAKVKTEHGGDKRNRFLHREEVKAASKKRRRRESKRLEAQPTQRS